jgi:hypothetical protein
MVVNSSLTIFTELASNNKAGGFPDGFPKAVDLLLLQKQISNSRDHQAARYGDHSADANLDESDTPVQVQSGL